MAKAAGVGVGEYDMRVSVTPWMVALFVALIVALIPG